jgi:hypothetical protein
MKKKNLLLAFLLMIGAGSFAQTIDYSLIPYRSGDKWGYADPDRKIVIAPKYADAQWFSEGYAAVKVGSKWGYINKAGKMVIPARYTVAKSFRKGYVPRANKAGGDSILFAGASTTANGYEKCITTRGVILPQCPAISENSVAENNIPVETVVREKTYSLPNNNGLFDKVVDDYKIPGSDETYYIAQKNGMYGVFNSKFETIVPFEYSSVKQLKSGNNMYLQVQKNGMNGILNSNGQQDITPDYSNLTIIRGNNNSDYVIVKKDGKTYVKDMSNKDIIPMGYADVMYDNNGGFVIVDDKNNQGFYFMDNKTIQPKYSEVRMLNGGRYLQIRTSNGKTGYINSAGDEYFVE